MEFMIEKIPTWALCYFVNDDATGLTNEEIEMADKWWTENKVQYVTPAPEKEGECYPYFDHFPAFGLATEVLDCSVATLK